MASTSMSNTNRAIKRPTQDGLELETLGSPRTAATDSSVATVQAIENKPEDPSPGGIQPLYQEKEVDKVCRVRLDSERTGWARISDLYQKYDQARVQDVKEDIDTLLVFVSLSSRHLAT